MMVVADNSGGNDNGYDGDRRVYGGVGDAVSCDDGVCW